MMASLPGRTTPDGSSDNLYVTPSITSVWPALWPPWNRTTTSARLDSQSTILPLPSSPHWTPTTTTFAIALPYSACSKSADRDRLWRAGGQHILAAEALGLLPRIRHRHKAADGDHILDPQRLRDFGCGAERQIDARGSRLHRRSLQDGIGEQAEADRGLTAQLPTG